VNVQRLQCCKEKRVREAKAEACNKSLHSTAQHEMHVQHCPVVLQSGPSSAALHRLHRFPDRLPVSAGKPYVNVGIENPRVALLLGALLLATGKTVSTAQKEVRHKLSGTCAVIPFLQQSICL
jgi:hypothetical protein